MKKHFLIALIATLSLFLTNVSHAQGGKRIPKWVPAKGFWVVESNVKTPENSIIYFYTNNGVVVYKERIEGTKINLARKRVLRRLKSVLDRSIAAWEVHHIAKEDENLVATAIRK